MEPSPTGGGWRSLRFAHVWRLARPSMWRTRTREAVPDGTTLRAMCYGVPLQPLAATTFVPAAPAGSTSAAAAAWRHVEPLLGVSDCSLAAAGHQGECQPAPRGLAGKWHLQVRFPDGSEAMAKMPHTHICAECDAMYPCPDPDGCPCITTGERTGLCPKCQTEAGVEIVSRSEDGFEAIIRQRPKSPIRVQ